MWRASPAGHSSIIASCGARRSPAAGLALVPGALDFVGVDLARVLGAELDLALQCWHACAPRAAVDLEMPPHSPQVSSRRAPSPSASAASAATAGAYSAGTARGSAPGCRLVAPRDARLALDLRREHLKRFARANWSVRLSATDARVALAVDVVRVGVDLVLQHDAHRHRAQARARVRAGDDEQAAGEVLHQHRVRGVARLRLGELRRSTGVSSIIGCRRCFDTRLPVSVVGITSIIGHGTWSAM
jgi:hypothetical protein